MMLSASVRWRTSKLMTLRSSLFRGTGFNITAGGGAYLADDYRLSEFEPHRRDFDSVIGDVTTRQSNSHIYGNIRLPGNVLWTLGLSFDTFDEPAITLRRLNPKFGVQWSPVDWLRIRGAFFKTVKRSLIVDQTLEPTEVAGFNQFFDDINGSTTTRYGVGLDARLMKGLYSGVEISGRKLDVPAFEQDLRELASTEHQNEYLARSYLNWLAIHQFLTGRGLTAGVGV